MLDWIRERYKALVPLVMIGIYLINRHYGIDLPITQDEVVILFGVLTSIGVERTANRKKPE